MPRNIWQKSLTISRYSSIFSFFTCWGQAWQPHFLSIYLPDCSNVSSHVLEFCRFQLLHVIYCNLSFENNISSEMVKDDNCLGCASKKKCATRNENMPKMCRIGPMSILNFHWTTITTDWLYNILSFHFLHKYSQPRHFGLSTTRLYSLQLFI